MAQNTPKIYISKQQHYGCMMCGRCCRRFHVLITKAEIERLSKLDWTGEADVPEAFFTEIKGFNYFKRKDDGGCVFLDDRGVCRMHKRFGFERKALTCRGYPFNIVSTFKGEVSVLARMDCSSVVDDCGPEIRAQEKDIEKLVSELRFGNGFSPEQLCGMDRKAVEALCAHLQEIVNDASLSMPDRARLLMALADRAERLGGVFLSDHKTMEEVYPSLIASMKAALPEQLRFNIGFLARCLFRQWLASYCRRDEEILHPGMGTRIAHAWNIAKLTAGFGNLCKLGWEHPDFPARKASLFDTRQVKSTSDAWDIFRKFLSVRLECFQFFGVAYYGTNIFDGLRTLFLTYPVTLALARLSAASRGAGAIEREDVRYAVLAMDHAHGRSPALRFKTTRTREKFFASQYSQLIFSLGEE